MDDSQIIGLDVGTHYLVSFALPVFLPHQGGHGFRSFVPAGFDLYEKRRTFRFGHEINLQCAVRFGIVVERISVLHQGGCHGTFHHGTVVGIRIPENDVCGIVRIHQCHKQSRVIHEDLECILDHLSGQRFVRFSKIAAERYQSCLIQPVERVSIGLLTYALFLLDIGIDEFLVLLGELTGYRVKTSVDLHTSSLTGILPSILFQYGKDVLQYIGGSYIILRFSIRLHGLWHSSDDHVCPEMFRERLMEVIIDTFEVLNVGTHF